MNLLTSFKNLFTGNVSKIASKRRSEDVCLKTLQAMQAVCSRLPEGKLFVSMDAGELTLCLKWNADKESQYPKQAFELDGKGKVTLYEEDNEYQEDMVKPTELSEVKPTVIIKVKAAEKPEMMHVEKNIEEQKAKTAEKQEEKTAEKPTLMQLLTAFFQSHYAFRYNLLTEQVECAMLGEYQDEGHTLVYTPVAS